MAELILTEKFSVASDFAKALGISKKSDGYFRSEQTIITWAVGHLVELYEPEDYDATLKKWRIETLPVIPEKFRYKPIKKTYKQFQIIKSLLKKKDIERVIIATDAGREGEVIARTILLESGFTDKKRIFRFWTSQALVPDVVRQTMNQLKPITHYDRLWRAGYYRQVADWLVGMNCTRMVTLRLHGDLFSVGRVQTAVLALIVDRKHQRDRFVPEIYWIIKVLFSNEKGAWTGYWFKAGPTRSDANSKAIHILKKKEDLDATLQKISQPVSGIVQSIKKEKKKEPPPFLFSLTDLQQEANRRFGFSAQKTLNIAQSLYQEKKCLSYPRTDSRVLGTQNLEMVQNILNKLGEIYQDIFKGVQSSKISLSNKRVFNDAKLTDHHALIPFKPIPQSATKDEIVLFNLVMTRFAAAFYPDCEFENTHVVTLLSGETFQTHGRITLVSGWRAIYQEQPQARLRLPKSTARGRSDADPDSSFQQETSENIPPLVAGDAANPDKIASEEKQTSPPPDYTDSLILKDMTNPGKYVEQEEIKKLYRGDTGIGTQATRAQIIETLINRQYIERSGKKLIPTEKGVFLVEILRKCTTTSVLTSPEETARWEMSLNRIALGETSENYLDSSNRSGSSQTFDLSFLDHIKKFITLAVNELKLTNLEVKNLNLESPASAIIGKCPACGKPVRENRKSFSCSDRSCKFVIWKKIAGKILSPGMASNLIEFGKAGPFKGFISREKKSFSASLVLNQQEGEWRVSFEFNSNKDLNKEKKVFSGNALFLDNQKNRSIDNKVARPSSQPQCPLCGGNIIQGKKGYGCSNWREEHGNCHFVIWKEIMGRKLTEKNIETLVSGKSTPLYVLKDKHGNKFKAKLKMMLLKNRESDSYMNGGEQKKSHADTIISHDNSICLSAKRAYAIEVVPENHEKIAADHHYIPCTR